MIEFDKMADFATSILQSILVVILLMTLIYLVYCTYKYQNAPCRQKIPFWMYLTNWHSGGMCIPEKRDKAEAEAKTKSEDSASTLSTESEAKDEVFFISNQTYNYDEALCKCKAYGGRIATKTELTEAYNKGAHWCDYGWVQGRQAFYPVQSCEIEKKVTNIKEYNDLLRKHYENPDKYPMSKVNEARDKMDRERSTEFCGTHAGLNGGVFDDPHVRFGVTCYGQKPKGMTAREKSAVCGNSVYGDGNGNGDGEKDSEKENPKCQMNPDEDRIVGFSLDSWNGPV